MRNILFLSILAILISSCTVVRQGEVGVKRKFGKLNENIADAGLVGFNPFTTRVIKIPIQTVNQEVKLNLPSKEGLTIESEISILYNIQKNKVPFILEDIGENYERVLIMNVFRSAAADVTAQYMAKDMHSGMRSKIENEIKDRMDESLLERGFVIERVLMKSIKLPLELSRAIERKLQAEQEAQQMQYVLDRERQEAERRRIEAEGTRNAQMILAEGLVREIIELRSIEAFRELANSPNTKIIITDGKTPYLINSQKD
ncbi:Regulator of protease activity HflC, stomatin/prohibitin superfamily [Belliella buryatensis]|uniref:Regulator of protease activity HflC, stomatin/prohibitin superfamily n=1 Tax=Belliella buryatensis TaxID=1500549 RepID=A0A239BC04_9BACT|nr:prohibitin family protein [Belliella buryatensis]SNS05219.1 Regulator of protease activity HflC, stomatin/prohibitin superfamily [Belliella buryatensis]